MNSIFSFKDSDFVRKFGTLRRIPFDAYLNAAPFFETALRTNSSSSCIEEGTNCKIRPFWPTASIMIPFKKSLPNMKVVARSILGIKGWASLQNSISARRTLDTCFKARESLLMAAIITFLQDLYSSSRDSRSNAPCSASCASLSCIMSLIICQAVERCFSVPKMMA